MTVCQPYIPITFKMVAFGARLAAILIRCVCVRMVWRELGVYRIRIVVVADNFYINQILHTNHSIRRLACASRRKYLQLRLHLYFSPSPSPLHTGNSEHPGTLLQFASIPSLRENLQKEKNLEKL